MYAGRSECRAVVFALAFRVSFRSGSGRGGLGETANSCLKSWFLLMISLSFLQPATWSRSKEVLAVNDNRKIVRSRNGGGYLSFHARLDVRSAALPQN